MKNLKLFGLKALLFSGISLFGLSSWAEEHYQIAVIFDYKHASEEYKQIHDSQVAQEKKIALLDNLETFAESFVNKNLKSQAQSVVDCGSGVFCLVMSDESSLNKVLEGMGACHSLLSDSPYQITAFRDEPDIEPQM